MEQVWMKAKTSFVNRWVGSVNKKQRFLVPENIAEEFVAIGIAEYETPKEVVEPKKSSPSQDTANDGMEPQPASLPAAAVSRKSKSTTRKSKKAGATSR